MAPRPGGGITSALVHHDSPSGRIEVPWEHSTDGLVLDVEVPPGTTAEVVLPTGRTTNLVPGHHQLRDDPLDA